MPYLGAAAMVAVATGLGWLIQDLLDLSNVALIFVVPVLAAALAWGLGPGLAAALLTVLGYNFFFLDPLYTFRVSDPENVAGLVLFSAVAALASGIASRTRAQALIARQEAARSAALYAFAKKLNGVAAIDDLLWAAAHQVAVMLKAEVVFLLPEDGKLAVLAAYPPEDQLDDNDLAAAEWCWRNDTPAGRGSDNLPGAPRLFLPLRTGRGKLGVAGLRKDLAGPLLTPAERRLLDALLDQTALAVDRVQLARDVDATKLLAETERLRTALLTSIGHDLRTPLASILGAVSALRSYGASYDAAGARRAAGDRPGAGRAAGALCRQPARHDPAGGRCARAQAGAGGHRRRRGLGPASHRPIAGRPSGRDRPPGRSAAAAGGLRPAGAGAGQPARERGPLRARRQRGRDCRACRRRIVPPRGSRPRSRHRPRRSRAHLRPFYRAMNATPGKGVGLGLAVAKGFVEAMGGTIAALDRQGGGSVFRLTFPAELMTAAAGRGACPCVLARAALPPSRATPRGSVLAWRATHVGDLAFGGAASTARMLTPSHRPNARFLASALGSIGVVYGDIGTSPLYAMREALIHAQEGGITREEVLGVTSLLLWALLFIVTAKYVLFLMRADNHGEGGTLSLMALAQRALGGATQRVHAGRRRCRALLRRRPDHARHLRAVGGRGAQARDPGARPLCHRDRGRRSCSCCSRPSGTAPAGWRPGSGRSPWSGSS